MKNKKLIYLLCGAVLFWFAPNFLPEMINGLSISAYHLFVILVTTVLGFAVLKENIGCIAFFGMISLLLTQTLTLNEVLSGFSNRLIWLIISAYFMADAVFNTGLGKRVALWIVSKIGHSPLSLSYGISLSGILLSLGIPSTIARANGLFYPILSSICENLNSTPEKNPNRIGRFLFMNYMQTEVYIGYAFLTSCGLNVILAQYCKEMAGLEMTWLLWALCSLPMVLISFIVVPLMTYKMVTPTITNFKEIKENSLKMYNELGKMPLNQKTLLSIILLTIFGWVTCDFVNIPTAVISFISIGLMIIFNALKWDDVVGNKPAWNTLVWLGVLVCMANQLVTKGFIGWMSGVVNPMTSGQDWLIVFVIVCLFYNYTQYFFASTTAHAVTMFGVCLGALFAANVPTMLALLIIAFTTGTNAMLTPYSSGQNPLFFSLGYFTNNEWWKIGFITSWYHLGVVMIVGPLWWKILGLW